MNSIVCKLNLKSSPKIVFDFINSDNGRSKFWAEHANEINGMIHFEFINGWTYQSEILKKDPPYVFIIEYFESIVEINLNPNVDGGTDLQLTCSQIKADEFHLVFAGWVSVLMALKAAVDHGVDLRNHNPGKCWDQQYVDN